MPGPSWSIPAGPGVCAGFDLSPGSVCHGCYAGQGAYMYSNTIRAQAIRWRWWQSANRAEKIDTMITLIQKIEYFRVFDSGDFSCVDDVSIWHEICEGCPGTSFWIPTRCWRLPEFKVYLKALNALPNVTVRLSSLTYNQVVPFRVKRSLGIYTDSVVSTKTSTCPKQETGNCGDCRACWDKSHDRVYYKIHGKKVNWQKRTRKIKSLTKEWEKDLKKVLYSSK